MNPETRQTETVNISLTGAVEFERGNSLVDFQPGDEVRIHALKNEITGLWNARKIVKR